MIIAVLLWIIVLTIAAIYIIAKIKEHDATRGMMDRVQTVHGRIGGSYVEGKPTAYSALAGYSVTGKGDVVNHYTIEHGSIATGFILEVNVDTPVRGDYGLWLHSLSKDQTDPYWTYPRERRTGTISYTIDNNGKMYFVGFTPD